MTVFVVTVLAEPMAGVEFLDPLATRCPGAATNRGRHEPSPATVEKEAPPPSWPGVIAELARQTGIPPSCLGQSDDSLGQPLVTYRQLAMALLIKLSHMSLPAVARMFGGLNHTTCLHAKSNAARFGCPRT